MIRYRVYIAGPLASSGEVGRNIHQAAYTAGRLAQMGFAPYCPHLSMFADSIHPCDRDTWLAVGEEFLKSSDAVLRLVGESEGADWEESIAEELGIPVYQTIEGLYHEAKGQLIKRRPQ